MDSLKRYATKNGEMYCVYDYTGQFVGTVGYCDGSWVLFANGITVDKDCFRQDLFESNNIQVVDKAPKDMIHAVKYHWPFTTLEERSAVLNYLIRKRRIN